ncbi:MAG: hypothetical protein ACTHOM_04840 [Allomuricauda sp.]
MNVNGVDIGGGAIGIQLNDSYDFKSGATGLRITLNLSDTELGPGSVGHARIVAFWSFLPLNGSLTNGYWEDEVNEQILGQVRRVKIIYDAYDFSSDYDKSITLPTPPPTLEGYELHKSIAVGIWTGEPQYKFNIKRLNSNESGYYHVGIKQYYPPGS